MATKKTNTLNKVKPIDDNVNQRDIHIVEVDIKNRKSIR